MANRNWHFNGEYPPEGGWLARSMSHDTTMYREIAAVREKNGNDDAISAGVMLLEVADAVDTWFEAHPDDLYDFATFLLSYAESDAVASAENEWYGIPGNTDRQESIWHKEYLLRMGSAVTLLSDAGYAAEGTADRHAMEFKLSAHHPDLSGNEGFDLVYSALGDLGGDEVGFGFDVDSTEQGLTVVRYNQCPPSSSFEPVVRQLVAIVQ